LGDLVKTCYDYIEPDIGSFMPILIANLDVANVSTCNNAIWSIGEIALKTGESMRQYAPLIVIPLIDVMNKDKITRTLLENTGNLFKNRLS
jgi:transportin-1